MHYRWHPLYGRAVRRFYSEQRAGGTVTQVEAGPGVAVVVPSWMLDAAVCASMSVGDPRSSMAALMDLHRLLAVLRDGQACHDSASTVQETHREDSTNTAASSEPAAAATSDRSGRRSTAQSEHSRTRKRDGEPGQPIAAGRRFDGRGER